MAVFPRLAIAHKLSARTSTNRLAVILGCAFLLLSQNVPAFDLVSLIPSEGGDGSLGFTLQGINRSDYSGVTLSSLGDINGDGIDDVIVGAPGADKTFVIPAVLDPDTGVVVTPERTVTWYDMGESYVVFGRDVASGNTFPINFSMKQIEDGDGSIGFKIEGHKDNIDSSISVSGAGDFNGDGINDIIVGAKRAGIYAKSAAGESYIIYGKDTAISTPFPAVFPLSLIRDGDGSQGIMLTGINRDDFAGIRVGKAGDVNNDGFADVVIAASGASPNGLENAGQTYIVFGRASTPALIDLATIISGDGSSGVAINGMTSLIAPELEISSAGDINGDGFDDVMIATPKATVSGKTEAGQISVIFGRSSFPAVIDISTIATGDGSSGFIINGNLAYDNAGTSIASIGDINNDSLDDIIIGAPKADPNGAGSGQAYVIFGRSSTNADNFPAIIELSQLLTGDGGRGFIINGEYGDFGQAVNSAGDLNNDGLMDAAIGAPYANGTGAVYVMYGRESAKGNIFPAILQAKDLRYFPATGTSTSTPLPPIGVVIEGFELKGLTGYSLSPAGDINHDGIADVLIGAHAINNYTGNTYVVYGSSAISSRGNNSNGQFGKTLDVAPFKSSSGGGGSTWFLLLPGVLLLGRLLTRSLSIVIDALVNMR